MSSLIDSSARVNLQRLLTVRAALLIGIVLLVLFAQRGLDLALPLTALAVVGALIGAVTLASWLWLVRRRDVVGEGAIAVQLAIDVAGLSAILYFSGGWTNPLISLYLVPVAVAAATLSTRAAWAFAGVAVLAYSGLGRFYEPVLHFHEPGGGALFLHLAGMWLTFATAAALIAYFGTSMAATLRRQERELAGARERNLRNEQIIGVATLAAGTAHELSTPLGSIAVIASELEHAAEGETREDLRQLLSQVEVCRGALDRLRDAALPSEERRRADLLLDDIRQHFSLLRPSVVLRCAVDDPAAAPTITVDPTFRQAILSLLDNAANASPHVVELQGRWCAGRLEIDILDEGPGLGGTEGVRQRGGMGMGLLLANATIERLGGTVHAQGRTDGGTLVRVQLPLDGSDGAAAGTGST